MNGQFFYLEDDEVLAAVTVRALQSRGFGVAHFSGVKAALECTNMCEYSFALLDLKLQDGNSLPVIQPLLQANPDMKIVVLTGYASIATAVQAVKQGAHNYLAKPVAIDDILRAFQETPAAPAEMAVEDAEMSLRRREWETIQAALVANNGNISATARQLKMHRRTLQRKLQKKPVSE